MRSRLITLSLSATFLLAAAPAFAQDPVVVQTAPTGVRTSNVATGLEAWKALPLPPLPAVLSGECQVRGAKGTSIRHVSIASPSLADTEVSHTLMFGPEDRLVRYLRHHYAPGTQGMAAPAQGTLQVDYQQGFALKMNLKDGRHAGAKVTIAEFQSVEEFRLATATMQAVLQLCDP